MSLRLDNVTFIYDRVPPPVRALSGVDFEVEKGQLVLVLGTTGSGKSTLLRVASGLMDPTTGRALIDGDRLGRGHVGRSVGLVFQDAESQLFADTVIEDCAFGPLNLGAPQAEAETRARDALTAVGLAPDVFGPRSPFALSGGEARRAAIAGVIAMKPRYLLADEPTAGLDCRGRAAVREVLLAASEAAGVVVVSHSSDEFLAHADKVLVLSGGTAVWWGAASALVADPSPLAAAGLSMPPVLRVQHEVRGRTGSEVALTLDPVEAARRLAAVRGCGA